MVAVPLPHMERGVLRAVPRRMATVRRAPPRCSEACSRHTDPCPAQLGPESCALVVSRAQPLTGTN